jgi:hypothetical protein
MTRKKLDQIIDHLWKHREYLRFYPDFDYPFYGGLKSKMNSASPEAVDAMQEIWGEFTNGDYDTKLEFREYYEEELIRLGEIIR